MNKLCSELETYIVYFSLF